MDFIAYCSPDIVNLCAQVTDLVGEILQHLLVLLHFVLQGGDLRIGGAGDAYCIEQPSGRQGTNLAERTAGQAFPDEGSGIG